MKIVIIGLGTGGLFAAISARKHNKAAEITIIDRKDFELLHNCGLSYAIGEKSPSFEKLKDKMPDIGAKKLLKHEAVELNPKNKTVSAKSIISGKIVKIPYDKLIIATGSKAKMPAITGLKGLYGKGIFKIDSYNDAYSINSYLAKKTGENHTKVAKATVNKSVSKSVAVQKTKKTGKNKSPLVNKVSSSGDRDLKSANTVSTANTIKAAVIGAGAIGLEAAYALKKRGINVVIIEIADSLLPKSLDKDISIILEDYLKKEGIEIMLNSKVSSVKGKKEVEGLVVMQTEPNTKKTVQNEINCSIVIVAAGIEVDLSIAKKAGLKCGGMGIIVDDKMQTTQKDVYAVGDIVELKSLVDNRSCMMQLASAAYKQGIVAGTNAASAGGGVRKYTGALNTFVTKIGELEIAATGFNTKTYSEGVITNTFNNTIAGKATGKTKPDWCNEGGDITVKIIADARSAKIVGAQAVGFEGAAHRIDICSIAIKAGFSVYDLSQAEMSYCPSVSDVYDILIQAADNAIRRIEVKPI